MENLNYRSSREKTYARLLQTRQILPPRVGLFPQVCGSIAAHYRAYWVKTR